MEVYRSFILFPSNYKGTITFLSTSDTTSSWEFNLDWTFTVNDTKPKQFLENSSAKDNVDENGKSLEVKQADEKSIHLLAVCEAHNLMAITANDKSLFLCKLTESSAEIVSRRVFSRTSSVMRFSSCGSYLFLADKTGDTFEYDCKDANKPGRWIFGHISQILDLQISTDLRHIITCDRDEKIRVTKYPSTHEIETFCLAHKEFVSSLAFIGADKFLLSVSGDKTIRMWIYQDGQQIQLLNFEFVPITAKVVEVSAESGLLAIISDTNTVFIYRYSIIEHSALKINLVGEKSYNSDISLTTSGSSFYIEYLHGEDNKTLQIDKVTVTSNVASFELFCDISKQLNLQLDSNFKIFKSFDVSLLFKKKYDNVKQYHDRKKIRLENQDAKKKK